MGIQVGLKEWEVQEAWCLGLDGFRMWQCAGGGLNDRSDCFRPLRRAQYQITKCNENPGLSDALNPKHSYQRSGFRAPDYTRFTS